jgi:hypothetical protein
MSRENLLRRVRELEGRPLSARKLCRALRHYRETRELPTGPRLRAVIERVVAFEQSVTGRRRVG